MKQFCSILFIVLIALYIQYTIASGANYGNHFGDNIIFSSEYDLSDDEVVDFDSVQDWFDSYQTEGRPLSVLISNQDKVDISAHTNAKLVTNNTDNNSNASVIGNSDSSRGDFYSQTLDGLSYVANNYINHGALLSDVVSFTADKLGIDAPEITTLDSLSNFAGQFITDKIVDFIVYAFTAIFEGIQSLF